MKHLRTHLKCEYCGKSFLKSRSGRNAGRFCSRACGFRGQSRQARTKWPYCKVYFSECNQCKKKFTSSRKHLFCSGDCKRVKISADHKALLRSRPSKTIDCIECGKTFSAVLHMDRKYCSYKCSGAVARRRQRYLRRNKYHESDERTDRITFKAVWERDGGLCYICGLLCSKLFDNEHDLAPSIDHKIPISRGGKHIMANAGLAHRICNTFKSDMLGVPDWLKEACRNAVLGYVDAGKESAWALHPKIVGGDQIFPESLSA